MKKDISFQVKAYEDFIDWSERDIKIFSKINNLIKGIIRTPFNGTGNPDH